MPSPTTNSSGHQAIDTWNQRITLLRERIGMNKSEFARSVGVSTATTTDWESGKIKMIDGRNLVRSAKVLGVTPEWIMTGSNFEGRTNG